MLLLRTANCHGSSAWMNATSPTTRDFPAVFFSLSFPILPLCHSCSLSLILCHPACFLDFTHWFVFFLGSFWQVLLQLAASRGLESVCLVSSEEEAALALSLGAWKATLLKEVHYVHRSPSGRGNHGARFFPFFFGEGGGRVRTDLSAYLLCRPFYGSIYCLTALCVSTGRRNGSLQSPGGGGTRRSCQSFISFAPSAMTHLVTHPLSKSTPAAAPSQERERHGAGM